MNFIVGKIENIEEFIKDIKDLYPYNDIFETNDPIFIDNHTHDDDEVRLFLQGEASFIIDNTIINCSSGTYLKIGKNCPHSFNYNGDKPLKVLRFFKNESLWDANYLTK